MRMFMTRLPLSLLFFCLILNFKVLGTKKMKRELIDALTLSHAKVMGSKIDAFTLNHTKKSGNPAGVIYSEICLPETMMISLAEEIDEAETAFVTPNGDENKFTIRWYTRVGEDVALCGHATLAAVHFLKSKNMINENKIIKFTKMKDGKCISAKVRGNDIQLDFPAEMPKGDPLLSLKVPGAKTRKEKEKFIFENLGILKSKIEFIGKTETECFIQISDPGDVINLNVNQKNLGKIKKSENWEKFEGFIVTAPYRNAQSKEGYDFVSRYFGPSIGIPEDPVTGSAHCILALYYRTLLNKKKLMGFQASKRKGVIECFCGGVRPNMSLRGSATTEYQYDFGEAELQENNLKHKSNYKRKRK